MGPIGIFTRALATLAGDPFVNLGNLLGSSLTSTDLATFFAGVGPPGALTPAAQGLSAQLAAAGLAPADADSLAYQSQQAIGDAGISDPRFVAAIQDVARATLGAAGSGTAASTLYFTDSGTEIRSVIQAEAGIGLGVPLFPTVFEAGIVLKEVITETYYYYRKITYQEEDENSDLDKAVRKEFRKNRKRDSDFNVDLGAVVRPTEWLTVGLSVRNLIPMKASFEGPGEIEIDPRLRLGVSLRPAGFFKAGFDLDVIENDSDLLEGYHSRFLGGGFEFDLPVIKLRGGYLDNLADSKTRGTFTAGFGLEFWFFTLDVAGQLGVQRVETQPDSLDGQDLRELFPDRASLSATLAIRFGM